MVLFGGQGRELEKAWVGLRTEFGPRLPLLGAGLPHAGLGRFPWPVFQTGQWLGEGCMGERQASQTLSGSGQSVGPSCHM